MKFVPIKVTQFIGRNILVAKKQSPHVFFGVGVIGVVGAAVLACRATLKLSDALDEVQEDISALNEPDSDGEALYVYLKSGAKIAKLYTPAIIVGGASIALLTGSHVQLSRRNAALTAAYVALKEMFDDYRERVRSEYGEEKEQDLFHGVEHLTITDSDGNSKEVKVVNPSKYSIYARFFDESNVNWQKDPEFNRFYIQAQQSYANDLLRTRGHIFLNEVYDMLGFERSRAGQVVGWVLNDEGDNYVSFGLFEINNSRFVNGIERSILLDFNVDGIIYEKI